jgi:hypothetical protein
MHRLCLVLLIVAAVSGCAVRRTITIAAKPADAVIKIDGVERGKGSITEEFVFRNDAEVVTVTASRVGYRESTFRLTRDYDKDTLQLDLKVLSKRIVLYVLPAPATLSANGKSLTTQPVETFSTELEFPPDVRNVLATYTITAENPNFAPASVQVAYDDEQSIYTIELQPLRKDLTITTDPPGAMLTLDDEEIGTSPVKLTGHPFAFDVQSNQFVPQTLVATKPGYDPVQLPISWDGGKTDYAIDLAAKTKPVRIVTSPPGAVVTIDGKELPRDKSGASVTTLQFPPINEKGDLISYKATVTRKTADSEWHPATLTIGWDDGRENYEVSLREVLTRPVPMLMASLERGDDGWMIQPRTEQTIAWKDVSEGSGRTPPTRLTQLPKGSMIDTLAVSPDGSKLIFTLLHPDGDDLHSRIVMINTDGSGGQSMLTDGRSLDLTPLFTPDGARIVFASNRAGRKLRIWSMSARGEPGIQQLTQGETSDLWPCLDADPRPRLFYQAMVDTRPDPRLFMTETGTTILTDLTTTGGTQPRVSPTGEALLFCAVNEKTGQRDIYRVASNGGVPENLTNTPDVDEHSPAWSFDGARIAYASNAGRDAEKRPNYDIWILDLKNLQRPTQLTTNGSLDDSPQWDPSGKAMYFRSNRGGEWGVWKVSIE